MHRYVLDSSVIIKWFSSHGEQDVEAALSLRDAFVEGSIGIVVPDLVFYEVANSLRHNPRFTVTDVADAVQSLHDMELSVQAPSPSLMRRSVEIAFKYGVTVYDACFLALAEKLRMKFVTADYKFVERLPDKRHIVRLDAM